MSDIKVLVDRVKQDLADGDALGEEMGVKPGEWCEARRADLEALLEIALRHADCHASWTGFGPIGQALRTAAEGGRRG